MDSVTIVCSDENRVEMPINSIKRNLTILNCLQDTIGDVDDPDENITEPIPIPFPSEILHWVIEFDKLHSDDPLPPTQDNNLDEPHDPLTPIDLKIREDEKEFFEKLFDSSVKTFFGVMRATNYLHNRGLLNPMGKFVARMITENDDVQLHHMFMEG